MGRLLVYPLMALVASACVTINIYFPAAAAEEAARTIVRDVLKGEQTQDEPAPSGPGPQSQITPPTGQAGFWMIALGHTLELIVPPAQAAEADINIDTPTIGAIRAGMQQRQSQLAPFYRSGAIGFDSNGSVAIRDLNAASLAERNRLKKLVAEENADRADLYREIARANGHPEWQGDVRATFAKVWVQEALPGYWYQQGGTWKQR